MAKKKQAAGKKYWSARVTQTSDALDIPGGTFAKDDPKAIARIQSENPPRIFDNLMLVGSATGEGYLSPPGDLRAYDVVTGKLVWTFHTIPHPGEFGYETWPKDAWKYSGGTTTGRKFRWPFAYVRWKRKRVRTSPSFSATRPSAPAPARP